MLTGMAPAEPRAMGLLRQARTARGALVGCGLVILALVVALALFATGSGTSSAKIGAAASPSPSPSASKTPTVTDIYQQVGPSVAIVRTAKGALGTGVVAADDGTVLTADHVVSDGSAITIIFSDGTTSTATVASADAKTDIATLTPATLPQTVVPATIGGGAQVGGPVVAIGNPLGLTYSVSSGVISGLDRTADTDHGKQSGLIQFDASVNPGSSGGPLLDAKGDVIGIVVSIAEPAGADDAFAGIAFAVPIGAALGGSGPSGGAGGGPQI
jgi:putative serine protease PepD